MRDRNFSHLSSKYENFYEKDNTNVRQMSRGISNTFFLVFYRDFSGYLRVVKLGVNCFFVVFQFVSFLRKENASVVQLTGSLTFENFSEIC